MLKPFELEAIALLVGDAFGDALLERLRHVPAAASFEDTGAGYFLTVADAMLPEDSRVFSVPNVFGELDDGLLCDFVVFVGRHELTLECLRVDGGDLPAGFRDSPVRIGSKPAHVIDLRRS